MSGQNDKNVMSVAINNALGWLETTGNLIYSRKKDDFR
jgi:hypothetical protein